MYMLQNLAIAILLSIVTFSVYAATDALDAAEAKEDAIVMACENQFTPEQYADEEDRTNRINECVDIQLNENQDNKEDKS